MSVIDVEKYLQPISEEAPCGEDLSYDPGYYTLEQAAAGKPEQQMGDTIVPAEEPNWREVRNAAEELMPRSKDLRVIVYLMVGAMEAEGFEGLRDGIKLLKGVLEEYWDTVHPQLDPDDNNDPMERMNIIASLATPDSTTDPLRFIRKISTTTLVGIRTIGFFGLRDIQLAKGDIDLPEGSEEELPSMSLVQGAVQEMAIEDLQSTAECINEALELWQGIDQYITETVGAGNAADISLLTSTLKDAARVMNEFLNSRGYGDAPEGEEDGEREEGGSGDPKQSIKGDIASPQDVLRMIDKICQYYDRNEPSSPVPLLMKRARKLVARPFAEILRDLTPDSITQLEIITGPLEDNVDNEAG